MLRVLELAGGVASQVATMALAELGADVIKVEPPDGDRWRARREVAPDDLSFEYFNRRKRSVTLDLETVEGRATLAGRKVILRKLLDGSTAVTIGRRTIARWPPEPKSQGPCLDPASGNDCEALFEATGHVTC